MSEGRALEHMVQTTPVELDASLFKRHEALVQLLGLEYDALKNEQSLRILLRETVLYTSILFDAAIVTAQMTHSDSGYLLLLAIPFGSLLLGVLYSFNDSMVSRIRKYIRHDLRVRVLRAIEPNGGVGPVVFGWEEHHRARNTGFFFTKLLRLMVVLVAFCGVSIVALFIVATVGGRVDVLSFAEITSTVALWWAGAVSTVIATTLIFLTLDF